LDQSDGSVQQNEDVQGVEQLVRGPEGGEYASTGRRRREYVDYADDYYQQDTRETCARQRKKIQKKFNKNSN